ncbi:MAG: DNA primase [Planctomycetota bacterium]
MPLIPEDKIDAVLSATDLVVLIERYLPLKRSGSTFKACCPFHGEKTPSFHVWPETQTWKCFGCGRGGSAFQFLMERERMEFPEAVRALAQDAGIELGVSDGPGDGRIQAVRDVLEWACRHYQKLLRTDAGRVAVEYCRNRGITGETAQRFRLGYSPDGWRGLIEAATRQGFPMDVLEQAGLIRPGKHEPYDWFRGRLMFPIQDVRDRVVGFGARALDDSEPKYLNSPDTAVFKKGKMLYALNLARDEAREKKRLGLVEGYTDVLMAHQQGVRWIVAALGTGLTREHAALARRYADRIDLIYDADTAGTRASERSLDVFLGERVDVRVAELPAGLDPFDFIVEHGIEAFVETLDAGREVWDFLIARAGVRNDLSTLNGRVAAVDEILAVVARIEDELVREEVVKRVAEEFRVEERTVRSRLGAFSGRSDAVETGAAYAPDELPEAREEAMIVEAVLGVPALAARLEAEWPPERFGHPQYRAIADVLAAFARDERSIEEGSVAARIPDPATAAALAEIGAAGRGKKKENLTRQFEDCVGALAVRREMVGAEEALARARADGDREEEARLRRELFRLRGTQR